MSKGKGQKRGRSKKSSVSNYCGFEFESSAQQELERIDFGSIDAQTFHKRFVLTRTPCIVTNMMSVLPKELRTNPLASFAPELAIQVEQKPFGSGRKIETTMGNFVDTMVKTGDYYMTTQANSSIVSKALESFNLASLQLAGNLKLANMNCWIGGGLQATSTPLHVDFQDNFYLLVQGNKQFRLFSPNNATRLKTTGKVSRVHCNGLINFEDSSTNADGSTNWIVAQKVLDNEEDYSEAEIEAALETMLDYGEDPESQENADEVNEPLHFCSITADGAIAMGCKEMRVSLVGGESLYLPAGYFHQVESQAAPEHGLHFALNFWYFPPDTQAYDKPYSTVAWY